jgi:hypothetical protein
MIIKIEYDLELSDLEVEILERYWKAPLGDVDIQHIMMCEGYKLITRCIEECCDMLERDAEAQEAGYP